MSESTLGAPVLTLDGPSGSGKGTVARAVAARLGWHLLDSGAIYRILALASLRAGVDAQDTDALARVAEGLSVVFGVTPDGEPRIELDGDEVTRAIRTEACGERASQVAALAGVRDALLQRQRDFRRPPGLVADGRDMGTVVFPDASVKIFLTASVEQRAQRRYNQLKQQGLGGNLPHLLEEIVARDRRDVSRAVAPLVPASDAFTIDTTSKTVTDVVAAVLSHVTQRLNGVS